MIYYDDGIILIRTLVPDDAQILAEEEQFQGDHVTREKYDMRLQDQAEGKAVALAAEYQGQTAGYISSDGYRRTDCCRICRYSLSWCRASQRLWKRPENVHQTRIHSGRKRRLVWRSYL